MSLLFYSVYFRMFRLMFAMSNLAIIPTNSSVQLETRLNLVNLPPRRPSWQSCDEWRMLLRKSLGPRRLWIINIMILKHLKSLDLANLKKQVKVILMGYRVYTINELMELCASLYCKHVCDWRMTLSYSVFLCCTKKWFDLVWYATSCRGYEYPRG